MNWCAKCFIIGCCVLSVSVLAPTTSAQTINQTTHIVPSGIDLVWEAVSHTPPFYRGKALYPDGGTARIVALPESRFGNPNTLYYQWRVGGRVQGSASGIGQNVFVFSPSLLGGSPLIAVDVRRSERSETLAGGALRLPVTDPLVHVYRDDPVLGVRFENALRGTITLQTDEVALEAYPYFFSGTSRTIANTAWRLNGDLVSNTSSVVFRKGEDVGEAQISVLLDHPVQLFQEARDAFVIDF